VSALNKKNEEEQETVLELRAATLKDEMIQNRIRSIDLIIKPGNLVVVKRPKGQIKLPLATGAVGILSPSQGNVLFQSSDWQKVSYQRKLQLRTGIGRIYDRGGWIQNLTLFDNILLGPRHHTQKDEKSLHQKLEGLADTFKLELVNQRPAFLQPWQLKMFQWIRALMTKPDLIVAEHPFDGVPTHHHEIVFRNEANFRKSGGSMLWVTDSPDVIDHAKEIDAQIFTISDERLIPYRKEKS